VWSFTEGNTPGHHVREYNQGVNKNMVNERRRDANGGKGWKIKYEITTSLFSR
jgi:hypothetical protein